MDYAPESKAWSKFICLQSDLLLAELILPML